MKSTLYQIKYRIAPIAALLVLSPIVAEVLFGATRLTMLYLLIPQICIYGGAALIIREMARRRGWGAILLLGIAYAIAEECVILQTSISPPYQHLLFGAAPNQNYLGAFGINWFYLLWALGYESVWAILLPIQLAELLFPSRRDEFWIGRWGLVIIGIVFLVPSVGIWYTFTRVGIAPGLAYEAPLPVVLVALVIILALGVSVLVLPPTRREQPTPQSVPCPWQVGSFAFLMGLPWFALVILPYIMPASVPAVFPILIGLGWAVAALVLIQRWSASPNWGDTHRLALICGAMIASMLAGFVIMVPASTEVDVIGKAVLNVFAVLGLVHLARRVQKRTAVADSRYTARRLEPGD